MKEKTAVLTAGFLSLGVLVLASNMTADGREGAKGKTIPYTLEITLPENAADGSMICFQQASQESGESKDSEDKAHENASGNLVIGYNQDTGRPSVFFTGQEEIILNEKNELVWKDCRHQKKRWIWATVEPPPVFSPGSWQARISRPRLPVMIP